MNQNIAVLLLLKKLLWKQDISLMEGNIHSYRVMSYPQTQERKNLPARLPQGKLFFLRQTILTFLRSLTKAAS